MAAINLNTVRSTIESRIRDEFRTSRPISVVFNNVPFDASTLDTFIQCTVSFGTGSYLSQGASGEGNNQVAGLIVCNVYTKQGVGSGENFTICKRIRDLYNRITVSSVIFDPPIGPEILTASPEGKFQTQIRVTFSIYEEL